MDKSFDEAERLAREALAQVDRPYAVDDRMTDGPWQVCIDYVEGGTVFSILQHIEPGIALSRECWDGTEPTVADDYGYSQPDGHEITPDYKIANARWIAAARTREPILARAVLALLAELGREGKP